MLTETTALRRIHCVDTPPRPTAADHWLWRNVFNLDLAYFAEHPNEREYIREVIAGEFGAYAALIPGAFVRVIRDRNGEMLRTQVSGGQN